MSIFHYKGKQIFYSLKPGKEPAFVFIHGLGSNHSATNPIAKHISSKGYQTLSYDLPGHGYSDPMPVDFQTQSNLLAALMHHTNIKKPILTGYSYGACIAAASAPLAKEVFLITPYCQDTIRYQPLGRLLFFWGPYTKLPNRSKQKHNDYSSSHKTPALILFAKHFNQASIRFFVKAMHYMINNSLPNKNTAPMHIIYGTKDKLISLKKLKLITTLRFHPIKNADHLLAHRLSRTIAEIVEHHALNNHPHT